MAHVILAATPVYGHVAPLRDIAADLVARGHGVTFLTGAAFRPLAESTGSRFVALPGWPQIDAANPDAFPERASIPPGPAQIDFDLRHFFIDPMQAQHHALQDLLEQAAAGPTGGSVVVLHDTAFLGMWPVRLGAPGLSPRAVIGIGVTPLPIRSIDTAPFGLGLPPDSSPTGRQRNRELNDAIANQVFAPAQGHLEQTLRRLGATAPVPFIFDGMVTVPDRFLQLTVAALEYERSDAPPGLCYAGALPSAPTTFSPPPWWHRVLGPQKVVVVTQGTLANHNFEELVLPTLRALAETGVLVVALTGRTDADLGTLPANAQAAEFIPFEHLMPHTAVLVSNGGYGGIQQALSHGIPLVLAGESEDKIEVTARMAHTGAAINLRTSRPDAASIHSAVLEALNNPSYRLHAQRLQAEYARHDALATIDSSIHALSSAQPLPTN